MEKFKAVEKAMKTKAYSKEGLSAAAKLDPKERAKLEACEFLGSMVDELGVQIESLEAELESIQATMKKGKTSGSKAERMSEIDRIMERHKWHQGKLELIKRSLENGGVETEQVNDLEENIRYYVSDGMNDDYQEDEEMYDELNLEEEEDVYGMNNDNDRVSSQDTQSIQEEAPDMDGRSGSIPGGKSKSSAVQEQPVAAARRPSTQLKSPLPALATLHTPLSTMTNGSSSSNMKPASVPTRAPGETLKYASAAAAAAASVGIAPLPPPPGATPPSSNSISIAPLPSANAARTSTTASPVVTAAQLAAAPQPPRVPAEKSSIPAASGSGDGPSSKPRDESPTRQTSTEPSESHASNVSKPPANEKSDASRVAPIRGSSATAPVSSVHPESSQGWQARPLRFPLLTICIVLASRTNGIPNGANGLNTDDTEESIYHLPSALQDLVQSYKITQSRATNVPSQSSQRMMLASHAKFPDSMDSEPPRHYKPKYRFQTPAHYPQEPLPMFDDSRLYSKIDPDTLFYVFYYRQGTYQQYLAAKALKDQSWRFHKQYQTWFQRHEEPKTITEEYEQGTYRFFDYESTWLVIRISN
jgi:CCR4-NOT transcription complex subunit 3